MEVNLSFLRPGDKIVFADGTEGICTVSYDNGGARFVRWAVPGKDWSESDTWCCSAGIAPDGRRGYIAIGGEYIQAPTDIVDIIKPPLHELQDEIERLKKQLKAEV